MNYEKAVTELETIIEKMETGRLSLEDSLKSFEDGVKLAELCQKKLKEAEHKVQILTEKNGEFVTESFLEETTS
jgi:exodeoxyribonuclease VII small subunit